MKNHFPSTLLAVFHGCSLWERGTSISGIVSFFCLKSFNKFPSNYRLTKDTQVKEINAVCSARAAFAPDLISLLHSNLVLQFLVCSISYLLFL